jgi:uncharacterized protein
MRIVPVLALFLLCPAAHADETAPLKALYITGGGYHDYPAQTKIITEGLRERLKIEFTVKHLDGGLKAPQRHPAYEGSQWADGYDLVIHNTCNSPDVDDAVWVENIARAHRRGVPGLFIHCAMHCFRATEVDTWQELVGVTSRNHEAHHPITVTRVAHEHPIMKGFPQQWTTPKGELYRILKVWEGVTVLATGRASEGRDHPVLWAHTYGTGRIFGTTLGHFNEEVQAPEFLDTLTRAVRWAMQPVKDR